MKQGNPRTVGELKASGWRSKSVRDEVRENLIASLRRGFILLGLRGQAKTRVLRMLVRFLDKEIPALDGCDLNDDPYLRQFVEKFTEACKGRAWFADSTRLEGFVLVDFLRNRRRSV